jgi:methylglutaconyl-CoA hydratase
MMQQSLEDGILRLTLPNPAWDAPLAAALLGALEHAGSETRSILIEAAPGAMFCSGADVDLPVELFQFREWIARPVVCAVQGAVLGPGVALLACAHIVVAAQGTSFGLTEIRTGGWPVGFTAIAKAIGERRATELALSGRVFAAPEALQMGLVHELAPAFEFDDRAEAIARHLAGLPLSGRLPVRPA